MSKYCAVQLGVIVRVTVLSNSTAAGARRVKPDAVWRLDAQLLLARQGASAWNTHRATRRAWRGNLQKMAVENLQSGWLLLLMCGATLAIFWFRTVRPRRQRLAVHRAVDVSGSVGDVPNISIIAVPFGRHGFVVRGREATQWASWADCIKMVKQRHPPIAATMMRSFDNDPGQCCREVGICQRCLMEAGFDIPEWESLAESPHPRQEGEIEPSQPKRTAKGGASC